MGKRRADADNRRFFDEFEKVRVSRFRATGVIDPAKRTALIPFPGGKTKLVDTAHTKLKYGGGWSYFVCPKCGKLAQVLRLIDDAPLCARCCDAMGVVHRTRMGFGRDERRRAKDSILDQLVAKLETTQPLFFKPRPKSWRGKSQTVYNSQRLTETMRRRMVELRLNQLASQHETGNAGLKITRAYKPRRDTLALIPEVGRIWRANSTERLQQALDKAQAAILSALESDNPQRRMAAARLLLNTKQARDRGL